MSYSVTGSPPSEGGTVKHPVETLKHLRCMRLFAVALLAVGIAVTILGVLALMGNSLPTLPFFQDIAAITRSIGIQLGTDPWTISILTVSLGSGMIIVGTPWTWGTHWYRKEREKAFDSTLR